MKRKIRLFIGIVILAVSLALLAWSFWPTARETRIQPISPSELTLPTPQSFLPDPYRAA